MNKRNEVMAVNTVDQGMVSLDVPFVIPPMKTAEDGRFEDITNSAVSLVADYHAGKIKSLNELRVLLSAVGIQSATITAYVRQVSNAIKVRQINDAVRERQEAHGRRNRMIASASATL